MKKEDVKLLAFVGNHVALDGRDALLFFVSLLGSLALLIAIVSAFTPVQPQLPRVVIASFAIAFVPIVVRHRSAISKWRKWTAEPNTEFVGDRSGIRLLSTAIGLMIAIAGICATLLLVAFLNSADATVEHAVYLPIPLAIIAAGVAVIGWGRRWFSR